MDGPRAKKTGPYVGPVSVIAGVGPATLPEGNMLSTGDSGRIHPAQQRARSMRSRH